MCCCWMNPNIRDSLQHQSKLLKTPRTLWNSKPRRSHSANVNTYKYTVFVVPHHNKVAESTIVPIPATIFSIIITVEIILLKHLFLFTKSLCTTKGINPPIPAIIPTIIPVAVCLYISIRPQNKNKIIGMCIRRNPVIFPGSFNISHSFSYADSISCNNSNVAFRM